MHKEVYVCIFRKKYAHRYIRVVSMSCSCQLSVATYTGKQLHGRVGEWKDRYIIERRHIGVDK